MTRPQKRTLVIAAHIAAWLVFLLLPALFNPRRTSLNVSGLVDDLLEPPRWSNALLLVVVFYFNYYIAIPMLYMRRRYGLLFASLLMCVGLFFAVNYANMPHEFSPPPGMPPSGTPSVAAAPPGIGPPEFHHHMHQHIKFRFLGNSFNLFMFIIVYAISFAMSLYEVWQSMKRQMLNTEISFLKAQINPHFLFNTLNSIYSLTLTKSDSASDAVLKLSGLMRYSVTDASQNHVPLSKEMDYINNYIALQRLRLADKVKISYEVAGAVNGKLIAPFLLIPFVENAFKYGVNPDEDSDIRVRIAVAEHGLQLQVVNNKVFVRPDKDNSTGLGIYNTRKRLELLYPGKYSLSINDNPSEFNVSLQITL